MPINGLLREKANPFMVLMPIRRPVKDPGPAVTANASTSPILIPDMLQTVSISAMMCREWVRRLSLVSSARSD